MSADDTVEDDDDNDRVIDRDRTADSVSMNDNARAAATWTAEVDDDANDDDDKASRLALHLSSIRRLTEMACRRRGLCINANDILSLDDDVRDEGIDSSGVCKRDKKHRLASSRELSTPPPPTSTSSTSTIIAFE